MTLRPGSRRKYPKGTYKMLGKGKYEILPIYDKKGKKILEPQQLEPKRDLEAELKKETKTLTPEQKKEVRGSKKKEGGWIPSSRSLECGFA